MASAPRAGGSGSDLDGCPRDSCPGIIQADDHCDTCEEFWPRRRPIDVEGLITAARAQPERPGTQIGAGIVEVDPQESPESDAVLLPHGTLIPEQQRRCRTCSNPVGRRRNDRPGLLQGFCDHCGRRFDFAKPVLEEGTLVAGQYRVEGPIGRGGLGWVYLAKDHKVSKRPCALKGLIASEDRGAAVIEHAEREALARLSSHPNIVTYYNYADHDEQGYIVMEYLSGLTLEEKLREGRRRKPLPVTDAISYVLGVLPAFSHIHGEMRVYSDFKPDNVMHVGDAVKLIDLGAVRRLPEREGEDDPRQAIHTQGFHAKEVVKRSPSIPSDLYTVGRTLAVLILDTQESWKEWDRTFQLPPRQQHPVLVTHDSLWRFLERACAEEPDQRFASAKEMAEQLEGVLRQVAARDKGRPTPYREIRWREPEDTLDPLDWRTLPRPILPDHPHHRSQIPHTADSVAAIQILKRLREDDAELSWQDLARITFAYCERDPQTAERWAQRLDPRDAETPNDGSVVRSARDYLTGMVLLEQGSRIAKRDSPKAEDKFRAAADLFEKAYNASPGEAACALGYAASLERLARTLATDPGSEADAADDYQHAAELYDQVAWAYPSWTGAVSGLARALRGLGRRREAAMAYLAVPDTHQLRAAALTRACRLLRERNDAIPEGVGGPQFDRRIARDIIKYLANTQPKKRPAADAELAAELYQAALDALHVRESIPGWVVSHEEPDRSRRREHERTATEKELRTLAETALWELAEITPEPEKQDLLDKAARIGPWRSGIRDSPVDWDILKPLPPPVRDNDGATAEPSEEQPFSISLSYNGYLHPLSQSVDVIVRVTANEEVPDSREAPQVSNRISDCPADRAELIIFDNSLSMAHDGKLESVKRAATEAVKLLSDGVYFSVIAGHWDPQMIYPLTRELAIATDETRRDALAAIETVATQDGTRIGTWLKLARELVRGVDLSACHVILLTDGENNETAHALDDAIEASHGELQCDVIGFDEKWRPEELQRIADGLCGALSFIPASEDLVDHFQELVARSLRRTVHKVSLVPETDANIDIAGVRQVHPNIVRLRARFSGDQRTPLETYLTGSWERGESREYHICVRVPPGNAGERRRICQVHVRGCDGTAAEAPIEVEWTNDPLRFGEVDPLVASYTEQMELRNRLEDGFNALTRGNRKAAKEAFGHAVQLAAELGRAEVLGWLQQIVHIDAPRGQIELRDHPSLEAGLRLLISSVYTSRTRRYGREPFVASCPKQTCGWPARATARYCERCGRNLTTGDHIPIVKLQTTTDWNFYTLRASHEGATSPEPPDADAFSFELSGGRMVLGRSAGTGSYQPDIALVDPGLHPRHGILERDEDDLWTLRPATDDPDSFWVKEPAGFRPMPDEAWRLRVGDQIFMGLWTCLTVEIEL